VARKLELGGPDRGSLKQAGEKKKSEKTTWDGFPVYLKQRNSKLKVMVETVVGWAGRGVALKKARRIAQQG